MSGRRRATLSPSLFPFLAVLVCTLGTLILFLALVSQKAEQTAQAAVDDPAAPETTASLVAEQKWMRDRYVAIRSQQAEDLGQRSSALAHIEDHLRRLREKLQQLRDEAQAATSDDFDEQAKSQEIVLLKQQIADETQRLEQLQQQVTTRRPRVVIVPHQGPHGTDQRPIYVECTADGVRLQPEGSFISKLQLEGTSGPGNPLDAALRTVRYHWQQSDPTGPAPYPLLVVRPDGIDTYAAARGAMQTWDDQFGYELIAGEVELAFPRADSTLRQRVDVAIREAVARQHARLAASSYVQRHSAGGGGRPRVLSAANLARDGQNSSGGERYFSRPVTSDSPSRSGNIDGGDIRDFDAALAQSAAQPGGAAQLGGASQPGGGPLGGQSILAGSDAAATGVWSRPGEPSISTAPAAAPELSLSDPRGETATTPGARGMNLQSAASSDGITMPDQAAEENLPEGQLANGTGQLDRKGQLDGHSRGPTTAGQNAPGATGGGAQASAQNGSQSQPPQQNPYTQSGASSSPASSSGNSASTPTASTSKTLQRGGRDWALPASARQGGTTIVRGVNVVCLSDAFVLLPEATGGAPQRFGFEDGFVDRAAMQLATAVHDRVDGWGFAIANGRWQPVLRIEVDRTAEPRYRQLRTLLQGSGLEMEKR